MFGWPAHTGRPAVATSAECCYACADTPGCNVWNFCPLTQGCGTGCTAAKFGPNPGATYVRMLCSCSELPSMHASCPSCLTSQCLLAQVPDSSNLYGPRFRFGTAPYSHDPLHYIPDSSVQCLASGKFPLCATRSPAVSTPRLPEPCKP
jgi:hypothetical protein